MYWKLCCLVTLLPFILIIIYLTDYTNLIKVVTKEVLTEEKDKEQEEDEEEEVIGEVGNEQTKFKITFLNEEEFKKYKVPSGQTLYYFNEKCPGYESKIYIKYYKDGIDTYFVPEEGYAILVNNDHSWTIEPTFSYWKNSS